ncbi:sulfatase [Roseiconus nitratireducens]|uniref:Sulfatase n=1 Tax=Roseiconus nitratireducens TaxID=2605748 RepID=A0A5M6DPC4_9BACT|nr:sulfatase [Roseiconus nitratireducens]KAA5547295.1 sulfatase [Roseiconus nitratireducens]
MSLRSRFMCSVIGLLVGLLVHPSPLRGQPPDSPNHPDSDQPNILWITAEDLSPVLGCYGDAFATTPHLDAFATQSTRYSHAFATAPVCSPSRACLINGCIATTQGTHPMRSRFPSPDDMNGFPALLRDAGYFTTNNVKTDYNTASEDRIIAASWDENSSTAHWRHRQPGQPFFSVFNLMTTHQSRTMVWPYEQFQEEIQSQLSGDQIHDPQSVPVPPYYPDTPVVRKTLARFYDCISVLDQQVGTLLEQLEADGLADDTVVFFYSDHGSGLPRHKRALLDSGMRIPLLIRFPDKQRNWAPTRPGEWTDRLVCFQDFAPTVLRLAGIHSVPDHVRGSAFLSLGDDSGPEAVPAAQLFGHRDRVDEAIDMARSVRGRDFLYIRNFMPFLGYHQPSAWADQGSIRHEFEGLSESDNASPAQRQYVRPSRPVEELYDCRRDPLNLHNLASSEEHHATLQKMRDALQQHMVQSGDLGLVPEIELGRHLSSTTPMQWAQSGQVPFDELFAAASLVGTNDPKPIAATLAAADPSLRYWGAIACAAISDLPASLRGPLHDALDDPSAAVQIAAADALARHGDSGSAGEALAALVESSDQTVVLHAARAIELMADPRHRELMQDLFDRFEEAPGDMAWFIRFTTSGYLNRVPN